VDGFKKAGALGVVFGWTDIFDENAAYQYYPFGRPLQGLPAVWVGRSNGAKLRSLAQARAKVVGLIVTKDKPLPVSSDSLGALRNWYLTAIEI